MKVRRWLFDIRALPAVVGTKEAGTGLPIFSGRWQLLPDFTIISHTHFVAWGPVPGGSRWVDRMGLNIPNSAPLDAMNASQRLNPEEQKLLQGLKGDDLVRARAQLMLQKQQETVAYVSNMLKGDTALQVIGNLK